LPDNQTIYSSNYASASYGNQGGSAARRNMTLQPIEETVHMQHQIQMQQQAHPDYIGLAPLQKRSGKNLKHLHKNQIMYVPPGQQQAMD